MSKIEMNKIDSSSYNWILFKSNNDKLYLSVICGGVGLYSVDFQLNDDESSSYFIRGNSYLDNLASNVRDNQRLFRSRHIDGFHNEN